MKSSVTLVVVAVFLAASAGVTAADSGPFADAGLDQEVSVNTTVQLDGTGSSHPDGTIEEYEWSIEAPAGHEFTPECADCARTRFTPREPGRYDVTLLVTDSEGRTDSDTLYVYVDDAGPSVRLAGPTEPPVDEPRRYNATAGTTNAELQNLTWRVDDLTVATASPSGRTDSDEQTFRFDGEGPYSLEVIVVDSRNRTARDTLRIRPTTPETEDGSSDSDDGTDGARDATSEADDTIEVDVDCGLSGVASGGLACVGGISDDKNYTSVSEGYSSVCGNRTKCADGGGNVGSGGQAGQGAPEDGGSSTDLSGQVYVLKGSQGTGMQAGKTAEIVETYFSGHDGCSPNLADDAACNGGTPNNSNGTDSDSTDESNSTDESDSTDQSDTSGSNDSSESGDNSGSNDEWSSKWDQFTDASSGERGAGVAK